MRACLLISLVGSLLIGAGCSKKEENGVSEEENGPSKEQLERQDKAVAAIKKLGGKVKFEKDSPGSPVTEVSLFTVEITDADLAHFKDLATLKVLSLGDTQITDEGLAHVKELTNLQSLVLYKTQVTDTGLEHIKGLTNLKSLNLGRTQVTDKGLEHVKILTNLQFLVLHDTQVTDAGLAHLRGLLNLQKLDLRVGPTQVTSKGVKQLQEALPKTKILR